ncbi:hypothetical protein [Chitinimonas sp.]|uniref:hypothetical protein n=1 Tax=Chitinimonas sp. TaxID=1934313 RepID=UPI0035B1A4A9
MWLLQRKPMAQQEPASNNHNEKPLQCGAAHAAAGAGDGAKTKRVTLIPPSNYLIAASLAALGHCLVCQGHVFANCQLWILPELQLLHYFVA